MKTNDSSEGASVIPTDREQGVCEDCHAWHRKKFSDMTRKVGECRLHAPQIIVRYDSELTVWPTTKADDWCCEGSFALPERG